MNTGVQRSSATPPAARTATTMPTRGAPRQHVRPGQERAADRHGSRHSVRRHGHRCRPARPRAQGEVRHEHSRRALHPRARALPARLGTLPPRHDDSSWRAWRSRPASSRSSRPNTAKSPHVTKIRRQAARRALSEAAEALRPPLRQEGRILADSSPVFRRIADRNMPRTTVF